MNPWSHYDTDDIEAVQQVLNSGRVNFWYGEESRNFEHEFAAAMDCGHAVALANGTVALDLALRVLGIGRGDEVVVSPRTFIASASCIVNAGAAPVFADVDSDSQDITAETVERALTEWAAVPPSVCRLPPGSWTRPASCCRCTDIARVRSGALLRRA